MYVHKNGKTTPAYQRAKDCRKETRQHENSRSPSFQVASRVRGGGSRVRGGGSNVGPFLFESCLDI
jgi:hypothetical protein